MNKDTPGQVAREKGRFSQLMKSHKALLATLQAVLDSNQLPPTGPTRAQVVQAISEHTDPFTKTSQKEFRLVWWQKPFGEHEPKALYVLAASPEDAMEAARFHIEKKFGILNFAFEECSIVTNKPTGVVRT